MNYTKVRTDLIKSTINLLRRKSGLQLYSKEGIISIDYSGIIASMKSPLALFEGACNCDKFRELGTIPKEYLYIGSNSYKINIKSGHLRIDIHHLPQGPYITSYKHFYNKRIRGLHRREAKRNKA